MARFLSLWADRSQVVEEFYELTRQAERYRFKELGAAITIQRVFRGSLVRADIGIQTAAAIVIERCGRGMLGRKRVRERREERLRRHRLCLFHAYATTIQRFFRGFYSRKYIHNVGARREYIRTILAKSEEVRQEATAHLHRQLQEMEVARVEEARAEFSRITSNLHHLLSTATVAGVYNPPHGNLPMAFQLPIEEHLKNSFKPSMVHTAKGTQKRVTKALLSNSQSGAKLAPLAPPFRGPFKPAEEVSRLKSSEPLHGSLRASSPFNRAPEEAKLEAKVEKLQRLAPQDFVVRKPEGASFQGSIRVGIPFEPEKPDNPLRHKPPFFTAVPVNKDFKEIQHTMSIKATLRS